MLTDSDLACIKRALRHDIEKTWSKLPTCTAELEHCERLIRGLDVKDGAIVERTESEVTK